MEDHEMRQICIDLSDAALSLFDLIEVDGINVPMDTMDGISKLRAIVENAEKIRSYYFRANLHRMFALGVNPINVIRALEENDRGKDLTRHGE